MAVYKRACRQQNLFASAFAAELRFSRSSAYCNHHVVGQACTRRVGGDARTWRRDGELQGDEAAAMVATTIGA